jgi:putative glutamine amidotransferase
MKKIIGLTVFKEDRTQRSYSLISNNYINAIIAAEMVPIMIPINEEDLDIYIDLVDGFLFTGGEDVSPARYGESPIPELGIVSELRDDFELKLFHKALKTGKPILGICRGCQLINVALGGTLYQDINAQMPGAGKHDYDGDRDEIHHSVRLVEDTVLSKILGGGSIMTNSFHHQAVKRLGIGLKPAAFSEDNVLEAFEGIEHKQLICVQWHPEDLVLKCPEFIKLFKTLGGK